MMSSGLQSSSYPASEKKKKQTNRQTDRQTYMSVTETDKDTERIFSLKLPVGEKQVGPTQARATATGSPCKYVSTASAEFLRL